MTFPLTCCFSFPLIQNMTVAKMSVYKRMKLACCFDCGRSERDCSCMSGSVRSNMDTLQRTFPVSSVSVNDCSTDLRACKFEHQHTLFHVCDVCSVRVTFSMCRVVCRNSIDYVNVAVWNGLFLSLLSSVLVLLIIISLVFPVVLLFRVE